MWYPAKPSVPPHLQDSGLMYKLLSIFSVKEGQKELSNGPVWAEALWIMKILDLSTLGQRNIFKYSVKHWIHWDCSTKKSDSDMPEAQPSQVTLMHVNTGVMRAQRCSKLMVT